MFRHMLERVSALILYAVRSQAVVPIVLEFDL